MGVVNSQASNSHGGRGRVALKLSDESLKSIEKGSEKFREHLKKQLNEMSGGFDPWKVVEEYVHYLVFTINFILLILSCHLILLILSFHFILQILFFHFILFIYVPAHHITS